MEFLLSQNSWAGEKPVNISLPDNWDVQYLAGKGDSLPIFTKEEIKAALNHTYGSKPLSEYVKGKENIAILIDDLSRGTPTQPIAEAVLDILLEAGVPKKGIRFISALGAHGAMCRRDFVEKLGEDIVAEYPTYNHNPYENCEKIGETSEGVPIELNREVLKCDFRIGIGSVVPHPVNGFGGGGKIVMPGIASMKTIEGTHMAAVMASVKSGLNPVRESGKLEPSKPFRNQIEEIMKISGFEFKIDAVVNTKKEIIGLFAGDPIEEYYAAVDFAKDLYCVTPKQPFDVVIANANFKGSEASIAGNTAAMALDQEKGGDLVIVNHVPFGQVIHYGCSPFGMTEKMGGFMWFGHSKKAKGVNRMIIYSPYRDYFSRESFCDPEEIIWATTWEEVEKLLSERGAGTRCGVFADSTIQNIRWNE